ncbi:hypothetical protein ACSBR1_011499 [Camellia fascicularis]
MPIYPLRPKSTPNDLLTLKLNEDRARLRPGITELKIALAGSRWPYCGATTGSSVTPRFSWRRTTHLTDFNTTKLDSSVEPRLALTKRVPPRAVHSGAAKLKDATSEAIRDWVTNVESTHYFLGSVAGPHPYPMMVREFHAVIDKETRKQALEKWGGKPDILFACVGGGSNAMGLFHEFVDDEDVRLIGVEAAGFGLDSASTPLP